MTVLTMDGTPVNLYGLWCRHGVRIMAPDPEDDSQYPRLHIVEPWPCGSERCSREALVMSLEEEEISYWSEIYDAYLRMVGWRPSPLGQRLR